MTRRGVVLTFVALTFLAACSDSTTPGPTIDSSRIVTLSGDVTEILFELGVGDRVVGVDLTTVAPDAALQIPIVGVGRFITAEGVLGQNPSLVFADTQTSPAGALDQIRQAGVAVVVLDIAQSFEDLYTKIRQVGDSVGEVSAANALVDRISGEIAAVVPGGGGSGLRVAYLYTRGPDVMLLFGDGMISRPLIEAAGAIDAGTDSGITGSIPVTAEALVAAAPDVIVVPADGLEILGLETLLAHPGVRQTPAGRNRAILAYPEGDFLTFGPRVAESLRLLISDLDELGN